jgi:hypothetical protein
MPRRKTHKYSGILSQPIYVVSEDLVLDLKDAELPRRLRQEFDRQNLERLIALVEDCGVKAEGPIAWHEVAMVLARRHVPAFDRDIAFSFKRKPKRGRPKWKADNDMPIVVAINERIQKRRLSIRQAATYVASKRGESAAALDRRYRRFMKRTAQMQDDMRQETFNSLSAAKK